MSYLILRYLICDKTYKYRSNITDIICLISLDFDIIYDWRIPILFFKPWLLLKDLFMAQHIRKRNLYRRDILRELIQNIKEFCLRKSLQPTIQFVGI